MKSQNSNFVSVDPVDQNRVSNSPYHRHPLSMRYMNDTSSNIGCMSSNSIDSEKIGTNVIVNYIPSDMSDVQLKVSHRKCSDHSS